MDYAVEPLPVSGAAKWLMTLVLVFLAGLLFSAGPVLLLDRFRRTAYSESDLVRLTDMTALESIPALSAAGQSDSRAKNGPEKSPLLTTEGALPNYSREIFRSLRTKVLLGLNGSSRRSLIVTSMESGAGKTMIAANQAISLAQHGMKTLVADGDLRRGTLHNLFGVRQCPGLSGYLAEAGAGPFQDWIQATHVPGLFVMSSGEPVADTSELITPARMARFLETAFETFDFVLLDAPPLGVAADAAVIHEKFSKYMIVVRAGVTNLSDLNGKIAEYPPVKDKIIGAVLNQVDRDLRFKYYKSSPYIR
jgi:capsular exopolysaccharide synthesis family protein